jgi:murein DD-endopeptidase MepM/ murein hydrolase activator NlpD
MTRFWRNWWWLVAIVIVDILFVLWWFGPRRHRLCDAEPAEGPVVAKRASREREVEPIKPLLVGFPTAQRGLHRHEDPEVYMATASGRIESAHYGSTRTGNVRGQILPSFHEGIDIAPLQRDQRNRALDAVLAIAEGRVGYANRVVGHSNYGLYVVLEHEDAAGVIYSLYAHLRSIEDTIHPGARVRRGDVLGIMGNTPSSIIPVSRSHLHFEVGMIQNRAFARWTQREGIQNLHGMHHGWNLTGIQPLALYTNDAPEQSFSLLQYLRAEPVGFSVVVNAVKPLDYFLRYPSLWTGQGKPQGAIVLSVSEGGVVLRGRAATEAEAVASRLPYVLHGDADVLGRNGLRLVVADGAGWRISGDSIRWLSILMH